ncbi:MAG: type II toxin-antitoxin system RelE/ParE family toxin [Pirellula sp.]|nr:type II toxin-antitoxin system RelE/ParE family toxin [Pirellula sp.]
MNRVPIVIEPEAKSDIRLARDYYSDKGDQTSDRFRDELTQIFELLSRHPEAAAVAFGRTRLKPMRYFPYVIGYIYFEGVVHVTGVQYGGLGWDEFDRRQF